MDIYEKVYKTEDGVDYCVTAFANSSRAIVADTASQDDIDLRKNRIVLHSVEQADALIEAMGVCRSHLAMLELQNISQEMGEY